MTTDQQLDTQTQAAVASQQPSNDFSVPEAYQNRGWVEKIKSPDDLWKTLDNAQSMLGKRPAGIPAHDAPAEEWEKFYSVSRPESPDKYELSDIDNMPEGVDLADTKTKAQQIMHKAGLTPKQANDLWREYMSGELDTLNQTKEQQAAKQAELDKEFDDLTKKHFGDDFESVQKVAHEMVSQYVPEELRGAYAELSDNPKALAAFAAAMKGAHDEIAKVKKEYGAEGQITTGDQAASESIEEIRKELAGLRTSVEARDPFHADHKKTTARIAELSSKVGRHYNR